LKAPSTSQIMHGVALALTCLAYMGHGRRAPSAPPHLQGDPGFSAPFAKLLLTLNPAAAFRPASAAAHADARLNFNALRAQVSDGHQRHKPTVYMGAGSADRRSLLAAGAAAALTALLPPQVSLAREVKTKDQAKELIKTTAGKLKAILADKESFVKKYSTELSAERVEFDDPRAKLPEKIRIETFKMLEDDSDPEFQDGYTAYLEAWKNVKDYLKLAALSQKEVEIKVKDKKGRVVSTEKMKYGDSPTAGMLSAGEYCESAFQEVLGASLSLDTAVKYMN